TNQAAKPLASPSLSAQRVVADSSTPSLYQSYGSVRASSAPSAALEPEVSQPVGVFAGKDDGKDQSYFMYRVTEVAMCRSLRPIGDMDNTEVRRQAKKLGVATAQKKDSQGTCFVGKVGIREFLEQFVETEPGNIVDQFGRTIGEHDGALFYTIGQ